jgi:hypothetical protein
LKDVRVELGIDPHCSEVQSIWKCNGENISKLVAFVDSHVVFVVVGDVVLVNVDVIFVL